MEEKKKSSVYLLKAACRKACSSTRAYVFLVFVLDSLFSGRLDNFVKGKVRSNAMAISS